MKTMNCGVICLMVAVLLSGCGFGTAQYIASAKVSVDAGEARATQEQIDAEAEAIRALAPEFVSVDGRFAVRQFRDTTLIEISVTSPDPRVSADACNQIAEKYISTTNGAVVRQIIEKAVPPKDPL
jgi:uncharacterized protein involved in exopolysaccharide biosynthesis